MDALFIVIVFLVIIAAIWLKRPLWMAIALGAVAIGLLYQIPILDFLKAAGQGAIAFSTIKLLSIIVLLTFIQKLMGRREMLQRAERVMTSLLNNRRTSVAISPALIGLLPSPAAVLMAGPMVEASCDGYMSKEDMAFITTFYRHVPESTLPTYSNVLLAMAVSKADTGQYILGMLPFLLVLMAVPYLIYLRKIPKETGIPRSQQVLKDIGMTLYLLWPVLLTILLILVFKLDTFIAAVITAILYTLAGRFNLREIWDTFKNSFESNMLLSTWLIMIFQAVFTISGAIGRLPGVFQALPIPLFLIYSLIFFFGTLIGGQTTMVTLTFPMAMTTSGGVMPTPLLILLMGVGHLAMQLSPTHVCLPLCCEYFKVRLSSVIKRTIPVVAILFLFQIGYYLLLTAVGLK